MGQRYEVHGRIVEWKDDTILRDETRRAAADSLDIATAIARSYVADGFAAWIFAVRRKQGRIAPIYRTVDQLRPPGAAPRP